MGECKQILNRQMCFRYIAHIIRRPFLSGRMRFSWTYDHARDPGTRVIVLHSIFRSNLVLAHSVLLRGA